MKTKTLVRVFSLSTLPKTLLFRPGRHPGKKGVYLQALQIFPEALQIFLDGLQKNLQGGKISPALPRLYILPLHLLLFSGNKPAAAPIFFQSRRKFLSFPIRRLPQIRKNP